MEQVWQCCGARGERLEQAQALLAQFTEAQEELQPWLREAQVAVVQLAPSTIDCNSFKEQQQLLQVKWWRAWVSDGRGAMGGLGVGQQQRWVALAASCARRACARHWPSTGRCWGSCSVSRRSCRS